MPDQSVNILDAVHRHMETPSTSWSIGSFGAIAEFHLHPDETVRRDLSSSGGVISTRRGAISINLPAQCQAAPYETLRRGDHRWLHGVNFGHPKVLATRACRQGLTELGADESAVGREHRDDILFDMGLAIPHVDVCVRTADQNLMTILRAHAGAAILTGDNPAVAAIKSHNPHRVFLSCAGRVEVFQGIGSSAQGIPTPLGPHTHVLPRLLQHSRTHAANIPMPMGHYPSLAMFPANPVSDELGELRAFDAGDHEAFQELMHLFAKPAMVRLKRRTVDAVRKGLNPWTEDLERHERTAVRVALRQLYWIDGDSNSLAVWRAAFDAVDRDRDAMEAHGH